jgi:hypothetical protein
MILHRRLIIALGLWLVFGALYAAGAYFGDRLQTAAALNFARVWLLTVAFMSLGAWLARRNERLGRGLILAGALASVVVCFFYLLA